MNSKKNTNVMCTAVQTCLENMTTMTAPFRCAHNTGDIPFVFVFVFPFVMELHLILVITADETSAVYDFSNYH